MVSLFPMLSQILRINIIWCYILRSSGTGLERIEDKTQSYFQVGLRCEGRSGEQRFNWKCTSFAFCVWGLNGINFLKLILFCLGKFWIMVKYHFTFSGHKTRSHLRSPLWAVWRHGTSTGQDWSWPQKEHVGLFFSNCCFCLCEKRPI